MNNETRAENITFVSIAVGVACVLSVVLAPVGAWIIYKGLKKARELRRAPQEPPAILTAEEAGLIMSWDDMPGTGPGD